MMKKMLSLEERAGDTLLLKKCCQGASNGEFELFKLYVDVYEKEGYEITPFNKYVNELDEKYKK